MGVALPERGAGPLLDRAQVALLAALIATAPLGIFAAQAFLALAVLVYAARLLMRRTRLDRTPLDGPILAFVVWTLLSASFSPNPDESFRTGGKKLVLFALVYIAFDTLRRKEHRERVFDGLMLGTLVLGVSTLGQYYFLGYDTLSRRPTGFLGHWMTASGVAMGTLVLATARLGFRRVPLPRPHREGVLALATLLAAMGVSVFLHRLGVFAEEMDRLIVAAVAVAGVRMALGNGQDDPGSRWLLTSLVIPVCAWALLVSQTRSAWLGALAGLGLVGVLRKPRALWLLGAAVALVLGLRPACVMQRLTIHDVSTIDRYYMWQAGVDMVRDRPIFGQGPGIIPFRYERYRWAEAPSDTVPHLHNNPLQLAAERGLPAAAFWLWWMTILLAKAAREARTDPWDDRWGAVGVLGFFAAILVAGMFEYNFGDSEVLYVILLLSALPFTLSVPVKERPA
jgi:O-antigen ligase